MKLTLFINPEHPPGDSLGRWLVLRTIELLAERVLPLVAREIG